MNSEVRPFKPKTGGSKKRSEKIAKHSQAMAVVPEKKDTKIVLLHTLNIVPHILFVIVNIVKNNKFAIIPTISFINNFIDSNYNEIESNANLNTVEKSKKFVKKFSEMFLIAYSKTALIDKGLILLAFVDIVSNEIPGILREANKIKFVDPTKIFTRILLNAKDIGKDFNK